jgi:hypothetical protein
MCALVALLTELSSRARLSMRLRKGTTRWMNGCGGRRGWRVGVGWWGMGGRGRLEPGGGQRPGCQAGGQQNGLGALGHKGRFERHVACRIWRID